MTRFLQPVDPCVPNSRTVTWRGEVAPAKITTTTIKGLMVASDVGWLSAARAIED